MCEILVSDQVVNSVTVAGMSTVNVTQSDKTSLNT